MNSPKFVALSIVGLVAIVVYSGFNRSGSEKIRTSALVEQPSSVSIPASNADNSPPTSATSPAIQPGSTPPQAPTNSAASSQFSAPVSPSSAPSISLVAHRIATCNGQPAGANFRAVSSLAPSAILGAVDYGQSVFLTGRTTIADGITWHEAIAPALIPAATPGAQNRLEPNQTGWIAACFVRG